MTCNLSIAHHRLLPLLLPRPAALHPPLLLHPLPLTPAQSVLLLLLLLLLRELAVDPEVLGLQVLDEIGAPLGQRGVAVLVVGRFVSEVRLPGNAPSRCMYGCGVTRSS